MWVMTSFGILMPAIRPAHTILAGDERTMQIRTRRARDLDILRARYMPTTLGANIHTPDKDYEYRAYCTPHAFALALAAITVEIDYLKFKPTTEKKFGDRELHDTYNAIWSTVLYHLSTPKHRHDYWVNSAPPGGWSQHRTSSATGFPALPASTTSRSYDRDQNAYVRDVTGDEPWSTYDEPGAAGFDELYAEMDELLETQRTSRIDHSLCEHGTGAAAKARCRRRRRRDEDRRIEEIRTLLDESYHDATEEVVIGEVEPAAELPG
jgi:hypothetical protein